MYIYSEHIYRSGKYIPAIYFAVIRTVLLCGGTYCCPFLLPCLAPGPAIITQRSMGNQWPTSYVYIGTDVHKMAWIMVTDGMDSNSAGNHSKRKSIIPIHLICLNLPP